MLGTYSERVQTDIYVSMSTDTHTWTHVHTQIEIEIEMMTERHRDRNGYTKYIHLKRSNPRLG